MASSPTVLGVLTLVGAAYLIWLGLTSLMHPAEPAKADDDSVGASWRLQALKGAGISGLNPKALLLLLALLPQFPDVTSTWPLPVQIIVLGLVHTLSCALVYSGVGMGAQVVLRAQPSLARAVSRFSGATMVTIGAVLIVRQFAG